MYKVLIIEDNKLTVKALESMISKDDDFQARGVRDENEALQLCRDEKIDIVFLGASLISAENGSGLRTASEIQEVSPKTKIYIIATGVNDPLARKFLDLKVEGYLIPPITFSKMRDILSYYRMSRHDEGDDTVAREIIRIIEEKKYTEIGRVAAAVTDQVKKMGDSPYRKVIPAVAETVQDRIEAICNRKLNFIEKIPVKEAFADNRIYWEFWLYDVIDMAFQKVAVTGCEILENVFEFIGERLNESIMLEDIAGRCNVSEGYLSKKMKALMGMSTMEYVQRRKLREAKEKIVFSSMKLSDIAYDMGYNESSYFSKVFKKYEGMTPNQFKKTFSGNT